MEFFYKNNMPHAFDFLKTRPTLPKNPDRQDKKF
jgi:hypothetical protein